MIKPKWSAEIHAYADGAEIEQRNIISGFSYHHPWHPFDGQWTKNRNWEYRIKPEPKPDELTGFFYRSGMVTACHPNEASFLLVGDRETGKLKSVRMIGKPDPEKMRLLLEKMAAECTTLDSVTWQAAIREALRTD